ncbi:MAG TPA: MauE/DoxX family redox-associated membrane protein [Candidatus Gracilibacteria bacterium]
MDHHTHAPEKSKLQTYWPLILVLLFILGGTLHFGWLRGDYSLWMQEFTPSFDPKNWMLDFMGLFFLAFAFFKLLDIKGFADAYRGYDMPTKFWPTWGYIYPFVELAFGLLLLHRIELFWTQMAIVVVLSVSIIGVIQAVLDKKKIRCACLGTGFNLPMTTVTIIEDAVMILMAVYMLLV